MQEGSQSPTETIESIGTNIPSLIYVCKKSSQNCTVKSTGKNSSMYYYLYSIVAGDMLNEH